MKTNFFLLKILFVIPILSILLFASCDSDRSNSKPVSEEKITKEERQAKAGIAGKEVRELMKIIEEPGCSRSIARLPPRMSLISNFCSSVLQIC
ncbi:hypothetical protein D7D25_02430 [Proteiniphilum sp. X52]|nr:hypothetical protein D7D25_02430 [Proteiniphilum sp. X52]